MYKVPFLFSIRLLVRGKQSISPPLSSIESIADPVNACKNNRSVLVAHSIQVALVKQFPNLSY